jgi:glycosyltransferase involved in cell wall biosynthesis
MRIGIDASNINQGGGVTHLTQIINNLNFKSSNKDKIVIWGNKKVLNKIRNKKEIKKIIISSKYENIFLRIIWQIFFLKKELKRLKCTKALVPGGIFFFKKVPTTIIMQNVLPFDNFSIKKYSTYLKFKFFCQKILFIYSIKRASKVIFISNTSKKKILKKVNIKNINFCVIPHGVIQDKLSKRNFVFKKKIKLLCVSKIDFYKNQLIILKALKILLDQGFDIELKLVGSNFKPALDEVKKKINELDLQKNVSIKNEINFDEIKKEYNSSNIHISPSICESFGITVIESGNYSLPSICSNIEIFKEIANENAFFFNPFSEINLANTIKRVIKDNYTRKNKIKHFHDFVIKNYSWKKVSDQTFNFINKK